MNTSMVTKTRVLYPYCPNMREFCVPIHTHHYFTNTAFCLSHTLTHYYYYYIYVVLSLKHAPAIHLHNKQIVTIFIKHTQATLHFTTTCPVGALHLLTYLMVGELKIPNGITDIITVPKTGHWDVPLFL